MAQLIVRNLEDHVRDKLRDRAQTHGRSMEEEVRDILRAAVVAHADAADRPGLGTRISQRFADCHPRNPEAPSAESGGFEITELRGQTPRPANFD